jgi:hypothetical protein
MAPGWMDQIPNYAICNFFYAFYVIYAVIFALSVLHIVYIFVVVKKFDLSHGIMLGSSFFTMALALVLTLFHYLVCDRALIHKAVKDVEGFASCALKNKNTYNNDCLTITANNKEKCKTLFTKLNANKGLTECGISSP